MNEKNIELKDIESEIKKDFEIIKFQQTPRVDKITQPLVWLQENKLLCSEFINFVSSLDNCAGLAANQVKYHGKILNERFFAYKLDKQKFDLVINPIIINTYGEPVTMLEGCLSWPLETIIGSRYLKIDVHYWTDDGTEKEETITGFKAQVWQHEMNHLDGIEEKIQERNVPFKRDKPKIGRNDPCPCGAVNSNGKRKKYKKCCFISG